MMPPCSEEFAIPAAYLILSKIHDGPLTLNRFFIVLLSQLTFFAHRPSTMRFDQILGQAQYNVITIQGYQYDTKFRLNVVPPEENGKRRRAAVEYKVVTTDGVTRAQLAYYVWQDGGFIAARGIPLAPLLSTMMPGTNATVMRVNDGECSSILPLTEKEFRDWPDRFENMPSPATLRLEPLIWFRTTGRRRNAVGCWRPSWSFDRAVHDRAACRRRLGARSDRPPFSGGGPRICASSFERTASLLSACHY